MKRQDKAERIAAQLAELYTELPIPLDHTSPYTLLVAVALSAQTTDKKVNQVTPALFARGPDAAHMARLSVDEVRALIREVGLAPTKAKHVVRSAQLLVERHDGVVPQTFAELEDLPGIGHKTASVVMSQAFGVPAFPVDTHIQRLASRWGLSRGTRVEHTEKDLKAIFPRNTWNDLHLQIIFFGREYCPARRHDLASCPICSWAASAKRKAEEVALNRPKSRARSAGRK